VMGETTPISQFKPGDFHASGRYGHHHTSFPYKKQSCLVTLTRSRVQSRIVHQKAMTARLLAPSIRSSSTLPLSSKALLVGRMHGTAARRCQTPGLRRVASFTRVKRGPHKSNVYLSCFNASHVASLWSSACRYLYSFCETQSTTF